MELWLQGREGAGAVVSCTVVFRVWAIDRRVGADDPCLWQHLSSPLASVAVANKLCQSFQTFSICYAETGLLGAHFVCDRMSIDDMMFFLQGQW